MDQEKAILNEILRSNEKILSDELSKLHETRLNGRITASELREIEVFQSVEFYRLKRQRLASISRLDEINMLIEINKSNNVRPPNSTFGRDLDFNREGNITEVVTSIDPSETAHEGKRNFHFSQDNHNSLTLTNDRRFTLNESLYESNRSNRRNETEEILNKDVDISQSDNYNHVEMPVVAGEVITEDIRRNVEERIDLTRSGDKEMGCNQSGNIGRNLACTSDHFQLESTATENIHQAFPNLNSYESFHEHFDTRNRHEVTS